MLKKAYVSAGNITKAARIWEQKLSPYAREAPPLSVKRSALLIVDMQRFFLDADSPASLPAAAAVLPAVRGLIERARRGKAATAYAIFASGPRKGNPMARWWRRPCPANSRWAKLGGDLHPLRGEKIFKKPRYSAFRGTRLDAWLRSRGVSDLVVAGVMTNLCVEATVRDAFEAGYRVFVPLDACAAADVDLHLGALRSMASGFAYIVRARKLNGS